LNFASGLITESLMAKFKSMPSSAMATDIPGEAGEISRKTKTWRSLFWVA
jgi:hypothetical protein